MKKIKWNPRSYGAWGPTWDAMSEREKRNAVISDWIVAIVGALVIYYLASHP